MKFTLSIFIFFFISIGLLAQDTLTILKQNLQGKWNWNRTEIVNRGGGGREDSLTCGCTRYLLFKANNTVELYENDILKLKSNYSLREYYSSYDKFNIYIDCDFLHGQVILRNKNLGIGDFGFCGVELFYTKDD